MKSPATPRAGQIGGTSTRRNSPRTALGLLRGPLPPWGRKPGGAAAGPAQRPGPAAGPPRPLHPRPSQDDVPCPRNARLK